MLKGIELVNSRIAKIEEERSSFYETFDAHDLDLFVTCGCGEKSFEIDYDNDIQSESAYELFGSLDDVNVFLCSCGEMIAIHYTTMDSLVQEFEYAKQINETVQTLFNNGNFVYTTKYDSVDSLQSIFNEYELLHTIHSYETTAFYKMNNSIISVVYNTIHNSIEIFEFVATDIDCAMNVFNYFKQVVNDSMEDATSIEDMEFSNRTITCLKRANINTVKEIKELSASQVVKIRNLGMNSYNELETKLGIKFM